MAIMHYILSHPDFNRWFWNHTKSAWPFTFTCKSARGLSCVQDYRQ